MESQSAISVAIVEDNPAHRETYHNMILRDSVSHKVELYSSASALLQDKEKLEEFDCALLDIKLPDMNGIELSRRLHDLAPKLPIVFITAFSDDDEALATISEGAEDYLPKGEYNQKLFMRSIRYAIERKKYKVERLKLIEDLRLQKELNTQQKEFVSMVSHEFRTPLAIISSSAQMIERLNSGGLDEKTEKHIGKIHNAIRRLGALIDNVLCFSKLEEGKIQYTPKQFNLKGTLAEMVDDYQQIYPDMQFALDCASLPETYLGDREIIQHVLLNLLSNAIKYSQGIHSEIYISSTLCAEENCIEIEIKDNGCGIPQEAMKRIGERFFRAENTIGVSGNGIGLHLVKRLLDMHQGSFAIKSEENQGTVVIIQLPVTITNS